MIFVIMQQNSYLICQPKFWGFDISLGFFRKMNVLFVWVPKAAGSSIYRALKNSRYKCQRLLNKEKDGVIQFPYTDFDNRGAVTFGHTSIDALLENDIMHKDFFESAFKFCFVRNPWDRLVSLFFYRELHKKYESFQQFCLALKDHEIEPIGLYNSKLNSQFNDQVSWIIGQNGRLLVDFIGRYERIEEDFRKICRIIGIRKRFPHRNSTKHANYREYYDAATIEIVRQRYRRDIEFFGYDF